MANFKTHDDADTFHTADDAKVVLTSVSPFGAVTTVTITDKGSDNGKVKGQDDLEDDETLPTGASRSDHITFDEAGSLQDTAIDKAVITITTLGLAAGGDFVNLTETITLTGKTTTTDDVTDDGSEDDASGGDSASDLYADHVDLQGQLDVDVTLVLQEKVAGSDGTHPRTHGRLLPARRDWR